MTVQMADKSARMRMAFIVRQLAAGQITNDDYEDAIPKTSDPAIRAVHLLVWQTYSDLKKHKLTGRYRLPAESRMYVAKLILFLHSDRAYDWPEPIHPDNFKQPSHFRTLQARVGLGHRWRARSEKFLKTGDPAFWPFVSRDAYEAALANPKLLGGAKQKRL